MLDDALADRFFSCPVLNCVLRYRSCCARQVVATGEYRKRRKRARGRGKGSRYKRGKAAELVACADCVLGRAIRSMFPADVARSVRTGGPDLVKLRPPPALVVLGLSALGAVGA